MTRHTYYTWGASDVIVSATVTAAILEEYRIAAVQRRKVTFVMQTVACRTIHQSKYIHAKKISTHFDSLFSTWRRGFVTSLHLMHTVRPFEWNYHLMNQKLITYVSNSWKYPPAAVFPSRYNICDHSKLAFIVSTNVNTKC